MIYSRTEVSNRDGENHVVEPEERERPSAAASFSP